MLPYTRQNSSGQYQSESRYFPETTEVGAIFELRMNLNLSYLIFQCQLTVF